MISIFCLTTETRYRNALFRTIARLPMPNCFTSLYDSSNCSFYPLTRMRLRFSNFSIDRVDAVAMTCVSLSTNPTVNRCIVASPNISLARIASSSLSCTANKNDDLTSKMLRCVLDLLICTTILCVGLLCSSLSTHCCMCVVVTGPTAHKLKHRRAPPSPSCRRQVAAETHGGPDQCVR